MKSHCSGDIACLFHSVTTIFRRDFWAYWCICLMLSYSVTLRQWKWLFVNGRECRDVKARSQNFEKLLLASSCPSVYMPVSMEQSAPTRRILKIKFYVWLFFENLSRKFKFYENLTTITDNLREYAWNRICNNISPNSSCNEKYLRQKLLRKSKHVFYVKLFFFSKIVPFMR